MAESKSTQTSKTTTTTQQADSVNVEIQGETIKVRSNRDSEFVRELASYVDEKAEDIRREAPKVPLKRRLLLVSMMVAEDYYEAESELSDIREKLQEKTNSMREKLEKLKDLLGAEEADE